MFLPVNGKTIAASVFILIAVMGVLWMLPGGFIHNDLVSLVFGLAVLYAVYNLVSGLLIWLIVYGGDFIVKKIINPVVGSEQHEILGGQGSHEIVYYKDGTEKHYFHYDQPQVVFTGGGGSNDQG